MKLSDEHKRALEIAQREAQRKIYRAQTVAEELIGTLDGAAAGGEELRDTEIDFAVAQQRRLSPAERRIIRVKAASTVAELDNLVVSLNEQLAQMIDKIDQLKRYTVATSAYARWNHQRDTKQNRS